MPAAAPPKKTKHLLSIPVSFGNVSIGDATARISVKVSRERMELADADHYFTDRRLAVAIILGHQDDDPKQKTFDDVDHKVAATADVKGFRTSSDEFSAGLTFGKKDVNVDELSGFA